MRMKKLMAILLVLVLVCGAFAACSNSGEGSQGSPGSQDSQTSGTGDTPEYYKAAYIGPLTGNQSEYGLLHKAAIEYTVNLINDEGGVNGIPLKVEFYDDAGDSKQTVTMAQKVTADDEVTVCFGPYQASQCLAAAPVFEKAKIALVTPTCSHVDYPKAGEYMTTGFNSNYENSKFYADFVVNKLGLKKVGLVLTQNDAGELTKTNLSYWVEQNGGEIVSLQMVQDNTTDWSPIVSKMIEDDPDLVYYWGTYGNCAKFCIAARDLEYDGLFMCSDNVMKEQFPEVGGEAVEGFIMMSDVNPFSVDPDFQAFYKDFTEKVNPVLDSHSAHLYDQVHMWAEALEQFGPDRAKINGYFRNQTDYDGICGTYDVVDGAPSKPLYAITVKDGQFVTFKDYYADQFPGVE